MKNKTQCDTCHHSRAELLPHGGSTILVCDYPGISTALRMRCKDDAKFGQCRRYEYAPGAGG